MTCIGTLVANRKGLPKDKKNEFYWDKKNDLVLGSYDGKEKSMLYKLYDFTKGRTDIVDQRMGFYTSKMKCQ